MVDPRISVEMKGSGLTYSGTVTLQQAIEMLRIASLTPEQMESAKQAEVQQKVPPKTVDITAL